MFISQVGWEGKTTMYVHVMNIMQVLKIFHMSCIVSERKGHNTYFNTIQFAVYNGKSAAVVE